MSVKMFVISHINIPRQIAKVNDKQFWQFAGMELEKLLNPYVPMDTGVLSQQVEIHASCGGAELEYFAPYARPVYEKNKNYRTDKHALATYNWDKVAMPTQGPKLIDSMQDYINSGRMNLSE